MAAEKKGVPEPLHGFRAMETRGLGCIQMWFVAPQVAAASFTMTVLRMPFAPLRNCPL